MSQKQEIPIKILSEHEKELLECRNAASLKVGDKPRVTREVRIEQTYRGRLVQFYILFRAKVPPCCVQQYLSQQKITSISLPILAWDWL